jgi:hypothetical protein
MEIKRTSQELVSIYTRLKHTAETLDQSVLDHNRTEDYVNLTFKQVEPEDGQWGLHGTRQINSHPETVTKQVVDGLISRKTEVRKFSIAEAQYAETAESGPIRHQIEFTDDGRTLRVTESLTSYGQDNFLASEEQSYIIYQKSGKMRTLNPQKHEAPL